MNTGLPFEPRPLILDTDLGGDIDDLGALAVLLNLARAGRCRPLMVAGVQKQMAPLACIQIVATFLGFPGLPVGRPDGLLDEGAGHARAVAEHERRDWLAQARETPSTTTLYRRILAAASDRSVTLACIAPLFQVREFLRSGPDEVSPLDGAALARRKLAEVIMMGGHERPGEQSRPETNFSAWHQGGGITRETLALLEGVPVVICGLELGWRERGFGTGRALARLAPRHPLRIGYEDFFRRPPWWVKGGPWTEIQPWSIWDQITVLRAVLARGTPGLVEHEGWRCVVDEDGGNRWVPDSTSLHRRLALSPDWTPERFASEIVEPWMLGGNDRGSGRP